MPRHLHVATWIGVIATVVAAAIAALTFVTGKNKLADFFGSENKEYRTPDATRIETLNPEITKSSEKPGQYMEITLDQIFDLWTPKLTQLESRRLTQNLNGKTVNLFGYLVDSRTSIFGSSAEISSSRSGDRAFYLNIDSSDIGNWAIPKESYIGVRTTLKQPLMGRMVGTGTKLIQVTNKGE